VTHFQYVGARTLFVLGGTTGRRYHFVGHGAILAVDPGDRTTLMRIPWLKEVAV
jgi:hypothetical protein